ncbi:hypothetical protein C478_17996 [Natrinema thermotolerans DSM 11552]|nr:hypothetical protein C478_17996 [Natrinema thermotolerans DSM 11552]
MAWSELDACSERGVLIWLCPVTVFDARGFICLPVDSKRRDNLQELLAGRTLVGVEVLGREYAVQAVEQSRVFVVRVYIECVSNLCEPVQFPENVDKPLDLAQV